jgi:hypothetical protein
MRALLKVLGCTPVLWSLTQGEMLFGQTLKEMKSEFLVKRPVDLAGGGEPFFNLFTVLFLASALVVIGIIVLGMRSAAGRLEREASDEIRGEEESYFLHMAFLAGGYGAIILMLAYLPPALTPGLGATTRVILIGAAVFISVAHLLAAKDERKLAPLLKYLFSGSVLLAALFFHLALKKWTFLKFDDPFYAGVVPYVALGFIILLVIIYSGYIGWQHRKFGTRKYRPRW